jgi:uncharacterized repeat protein (TIGR02543 family)
MSITKFRTRVLVGVVSTALVAAPLVFSAGVASADAGSWSSTNSTTIDLTNYNDFNNDGYLNSVSCITGTTCVAGGETANLDGEGPASPMQLTGDATNWGVGGSGDSTETDGTDAVNDPLPVGGNTSLSFYDLGYATDGDVTGADINSISCTTTTSCVAVGQDYNNKPFALLGSPASWTKFIEFNNVDDGDVGSFNGVSCVSSSWCLAVGEDSDDNVIILSGDPSTWTANEEINGFSPSTGSDDAESDVYVNGVSCLDETHCVAVGSVTDTVTTYIDDEPTLRKNHIRNSHSGPTPVMTVSQDLLSFNGDPASWSTSAPVLNPVPSGDYGNLTSVSCTAITFCVAVGNVSPIDDSQSVDTPLIFLTGDPTGWTSENDINFYGLDYLLSGYTPVQSFNSVSCVLATDDTDYCAAVGEDGNNEPLVLSGDPLTWASDSVTTEDNTNQYATEIDPQIDPDLYSWGEFLGVSCTAVDTCVAVGHFYVEGEDNDLLRHPSAAVQSPSPAGPFTAWIGPPANPSTVGGYVPPPLYPVTYLPGGATGTVPTQTSLYPTQTFTVAAPSSLSDPGYTFEGWSDGTSIYQPGSIYTMPAAPVTLTAQWVSTTPTSPSNPATPSSVTKPLLRTEVLFPFNKYYLTAQAKKKLISFAKEIVKAQVTTFTVVGSTDLFGGEAYNIPLSDHRAHTVSDFLTAQLASLGDDDVVFHDTWIGILRTQPTYTQNRRTVVSD